MRYTYEERLDIGRRIYDDELTKFEAAEKYDVSINSARDYMRLYRDANNLPPKNRKGAGRPVSLSKESVRKNLEELNALTKEELVLELVKARIAEERLKKGYEVKGDGSIILYDSKNTK